MSYNVGPNSYPLNPKSFGAVLNGTTNDTAAWQSIYNAAPSNATIDIPVGNQLNYGITETSTKNVHWNCLGTLDYGTSSAGTNPVTNFGDGDVLTAYFGGRYNFVKNITSSTNGYAVVDLSLTNSSTNQFALADVVSGLVVNATSAAGAAGYTWAVNTVLNSGASGGVNSQDVAYASTVYRNGTSSTWSFYGASTDVTGLAPTTSGMVGFECDLICNGPETSSTYWSPDYGCRASITINTAAYQPNNWAATTAYSVGSVVTGTTSPASLHTFVCTVAGTSSSTQPTWPTSTGTVTDGTVTWEYGTTIAAQISRGILINAISGTQFAAGIFFLGSYYDALLDLSFGTLAASSCAGIRLAPNMPIDFAGGTSTQNIRTLLYNSTSGNFEYQKSGSAVVSISDIGAIGLGTTPASNVGLTIGGSSTLAIDTAFCSGSVAIRFGSGQLLNWEATGVITTGYTSGKLTDSSGATVLRTLDTNGNQVLKGSITYSASCDGNIQSSSPTTGFSTTIPTACSHYIFSPSGTLATGTITLPSSTNALVGQQLNILTTQTITSLTVNAGSGNTITNAPTTLSANASVDFIYSGTTWYRLR